MFQYQTQEVRKFDGGFTDQPETGRPDQHETNDNMQPDRDGTVRTRDGSRVYSYEVPNYTQAGNTTGNRISEFVLFKDTVMAMSAGRLRFDLSGTLTTINPTQNTNKLLSNGSVSGNQYQAILDDKLILCDDEGSKPVILTENGDTWTNGSSTRVRTLGLPNIPLANNSQEADITVTPSAPSASAVYLYYIVFFYKYEANGKTYETYGRTAFKEVEGDDVASNVAVNHTLSDLPHIGSAGTNPIDPQNYHTGTGAPSAPSYTDGVIDSPDGRIRLRIFRTKKNGSTPYFVGEIENDPTGVNTSFTDTTTDDEIEARITLYTTGGVINHNEAPTPKYITATRDTLYAANVKTVIRREKAGSEALAVTVGTFPNRIIQSVIGDSDQLINQFFVDVDEEITGMGTVRGYPIVFTENRTYRVEDRFTAQGLNGMVIREISRNFGCISGNSVVDTPFGVYFASKDGFAFTDGFKVTRISQEFTTTYAGLVDRDVKSSLISGVYDFRNRFVVWSVSTDPDTILDANVRNRQLFVFDERQGVKEDGVFYKWFNGTHFQPSALLYDGV